MLDPHDRTSLFEALRPPPGYRFDNGVGTSFSLNLEALLTAPIAFALFDVEEEAKGAGVDAAVTVEPVGLLESIRRYSQHLTVFCQAGQIAIPRASRTIYAWLEDVVVETSARRRHRIFHPKIWLCRYRSEADETAVLRLLCATRNLTLDSSLDTVLALESDPYSDGPTEQIDQQEPAAAFFESLASTGGLPEERRRQVSDLANDLRRVPLRPPEPFHSFVFHVLGTTKDRQVFPDHSDRALLISPFIGAGFLDDFTRTHQVELLMSRESALDPIAPEILRRAARLVTLNPSAGFDRLPDASPKAHSERIPRERAAESSIERETAAPNSSIGGLHAKLFLFEVDGHVHVFTGSANATDAAFDGNVEALVELIGPTKQGIDALLAETPGEVGFDDLCIDYEILEQPVDDSESDTLEVGLDWFRHQFAAAELLVTVSASDGHFVLSVQSARPIPTFEGGSLSITLWPITLFEEPAARSAEPGSHLEASFQVSLEGITSFFAVRVVAQAEPSSETVFVANARLVGAPEDRHSKLLAAMLRDPDRLLQYLILLLSEDSDPTLGMADSGAMPWLSRWKGRSWAEVPLLELLVRAAQRHPERLDHIDALLADLGEHRNATVPEGFDEVWEPVWQFRKGMRS